MPSSRCVVVAAILQLLPAVLVSVPRPVLAGGHAIAPPTVSQAAATGNYTYSGPDPGSVVGAGLDRTQPNLVHLVLNSPIGPAPGFHGITVTGVQDLAGNPILVNGNTNVGLFMIKMLSFEARVTDHLCSNQGRDLSQLPGPGD